MTQLTLEAFDKWVVYFLGPINPLGKWTRSRYTITMTDYLTRQAKFAPVKDCTGATALIFLFDIVVTRFGCPKILVNDQGTHFVNKTIEALTTKFQIQHRKTTHYHPQAHGTVEAFNKFWRML